MNKIPDPLPSSNEIGKVLEANHMFPLCTCGKRLALRKYLHLRNFEGQPDEHAEPRAITILAFCDCGNILLGNAHSEAESVINEKITGRMP